MHPLCFVNRHINTPIDNKILKLKSVHFINEIHSLNDFCLGIFYLWRLVSIHALSEFLLNSFCKLTEQGTIIQFFHKSFCCNLLPCSNKEKHYRNTIIPQCKCDIPASIFDTVFITKISISVQLQIFRMGTQGKKWFLWNFMLSFGSKNLNILYFHNIISTALKFYFMVKVAKWYLRESPSTWQSRGLKNNQSMKPRQFCQWLYNLTSDIHLVLILNSPFSYSGQQGKDKSRTGILCFAYVFGYKTPKLSSL